MAVSPRERGVRTLRLSAGMIRSFVVEGWRCSGLEVVLAAMQCQAYEYLRAAASSIAGDACMSDKNQYSFSAGRIGK